MNSMDKNSQTRAGIYLLLVSVAITIAIYLIQTQLGWDFKGTYPGVVPLIQAEYTFEADKITIQLSRQSSVPQIVVFAYDDQNRQVVIMKPVYDKRVEVFPGDSADYLVNMDGTKVKDFEILKKTTGLESQIDMFNLIRAAHQSGKKYGIQECLYPVCTICLDVCPVVDNGVVQVNTEEDGRFHPKITIGGCPRCGMCFELCRMKVIYKSNLRQTVRPEYLEEDTGTPSSSNNN